MEKIGKIEINKIGKNLNNFDNMKNLFFFFKWKIFYTIRKNLRKNDKNWKIFYNQSNIMEDGGKLKCFKS